MSKKLPDSSAPSTLAGIEISVAEQSPLVLALLAVIQKQAAEIQELRDEIQRLKKTTTRQPMSPPLPSDPNRL